MSLTHFTFEQENFGTKQIIPLVELYALMEKKKGHYNQFQSYLKFACKNEEEEEKLVFLYKHIKNASKRNTEKMNASIVLKKWAILAEANYSVKDIKLILKLLLNHTLDFLALQQLKDEKIKMQVLQKGLRNKGIKNTYQMICENLSKQLEKEPIGLDRLFDDLQLCHLAYFEQDMDHERKGMTAFNAMNSKFDTFYKTIKAAYSCERINLQNSASQKNNVNVSAIFSRNKNEINLQELYETNSTIQKENDKFSKAGLNKFESVFNPIYDQIHILDRYILCKYTVNHLTRAENNGKLNLASLSFKWYKKRVIWSLPFLTVGGLKKNDYLNPINKALSNKKMAFAKYCIDTFTKYLEKSVNDPAYFLGQAYCLFYENKFNEVLLILDQQFPSNFHYQFYCIALRVKSLRLKVYTEQILQGENTLKFLDLFDNEASAFFKYIHRKHEKIIIPKAIVKRYSNFIKIIKLLVDSIDDLNETKNKEKIGKELLMKIYQTKPINSSKWFENKIKTIINM